VSGDGDYAATADRRSAAHLPAAVARAAAPIRLAGLSTRADSSLSVVQVGYAIPSRHHFVTMETWSHL
jgi:hypothetical protein